MIPTSPFGRTGHDSTRVIFGAAALSRVTQDEADTTLELVASHGINHLDVARSYGEAEVRMRPFLSEHRDAYFLATKTEDRTAEGAYAQLGESLERLGTDHVDLLQLHNLVDEQQWRTAYAPGGALEGVVRALDEGLTRAVGVTGHGVTVARQHLRSLQEYDFASVLLPYNFPMSRNERYLADFEELVAVCEERGTAVQTIKSITKAAWPDADRETGSNGDRDQHFAATWYEPLRSPEAIDTAVSWVLGREGVFLNTVGDIHLLPHVLDAAERFEGRPTQDEMAELERAFDMAPLFV
jgi:aryl-alcohol dehydrogenase-like predicted oxidoreductase